MQSLPVRNPERLPMRRGAVPQKRKAPKPTPSLFEQVINRVQRYLSAKPKSGGSVASATRNLTAKRKEVARLKAELKDEASRGGRGTRYDKLSAK